MGLQEFCGFALLRSNLCVHWLIRIFVFILLCYVQAADINYCCNYFDWVSICDVPWFEITHNNLPLPLSCHTVKLSSLSSFAFDVQSPPPKALFPVTLVLIHEQQSQCLNSLFLYTRYCNYIVLNVYLSTAFCYRF